MNQDHPPISPPGQAAGSPTRCGEEDLALVRSILAGDAAAWQKFVAKYSALLVSVIRRHLFQQDPDEIRSVYVEILDDLYRGRLATYRGRCTLAGWLVLVAQSHTMDFLRRKFGRREVPVGVKALSARDQAVFQLFYVEGQGLPQIREHFSGNGNAASPEEILDSVERIRKVLDRRVFRRCAYDLQARALGVATGKLLEYLDHVRSEMEGRDSESGAEARLLEVEARERMSRLRTLLGELPEEDREVLRLWFVENQPAPAIARVLQLKDARRVYTVLNRTLRSLRRRFKDQPI